MDYKYIEQLLERYWNGESNLEEEKILKSFFCQEDVPSHLKEYVPYFLNMIEEAKTGLSEDFDQRFSDILEQEDARPAKMKAIVISFSRRMMPFLKAVATVAVFLTVGGAALRSLSSDESMQMRRDLDSDEMFLQSDKVAERIETMRMKMENEEKVEMAQNEEKDTIVVGKDVIKYD